MRRSRTYLVPILLAAGLVLLSPVGLLVVFLSGDSCCGENTSGTMIGVTAGIVAVLVVISLIVNGGVKAARKDRAGFSLLVATLISAGPAALVHVAFVTWLSATSF